MKEVESAGPHECLTIGIVVGQRDFRMPLTWAGVGVCKRE